MFWSVCLCLQLMKGTVLAASSTYFIFSLGYLRYSDVYRYESGRCCSLPFLTFYVSRFSFYVNIFQLVRFSASSKHSKTPTIYWQIFVAHLWELSYCCFYFHDFCFPCGFFSMQLGIFLLQWLLQGSAMMTSSVTQVECVSVLMISVMEWQTVPMDPMNWTVVSYLQDP